ncbi:response regulator transcription factor [Neorhizobium alkalisoli]|uniref:FixJ family two-component response regulator n=1 Tax=Neorhizobium alkalisoli TaxID=528178 RepID=A0A561Q0M9_9HYPH|nr:LuxR C-terminal-related transcriptional regulator [Neorhizobium alkalisoli]TWF43899.1 FixJ family two-component response regulator [Neorhizobium alkalisoli]
MQLSTDIHMASQSPAPQQTVHLVESDLASRAAVARLLRDNGYDVAEYDDSEEFASVSDGPRAGCVVISADQGSMDCGMIRDQPGAPLPVIYVSQVDDVRASVEAMKSGAVDFLLKPIDKHALLRAVAAAFELDHRERSAFIARQSIRSCAVSLTPRERQVFEAVTSGLMNKIIAYDLGISEIMVKVHRGRVMRKMNSRALPDLVRKYDILQQTFAESTERRKITALN